MLLMNKIKKYLRAAVIMSFVVLIWFNNGLKIHSLYES